MLSTAGGLTRVGFILLSSNKAVLFRTATFVREIATLILNCPRIRNLLSIAISQLYNIPFPRHTCRPPSQLPPHPLDITRILQAWFEIIYYLELLIPQPQKEQYFIGDPIQSYKSSTHSGSHSTTTPAAQDLLKCQSSIHPEMTNNLGQKQQKKQWLTRNNQG
ncbi:hypothetical protein P3342_004420 [Pyrenophora teres f. teres]|nr:hypothetical protein P3342_004420 [Pyrenophora teres f. teres]